MSEVVLGREEAARLALLAPYRISLCRFLSDEYEASASPTKDECVNEAFGPQARVTHKQLWAWLRAPLWMQNLQSKRAAVKAMLDAAVSGFVWRAETNFTNFALSALAYARELDAFHAVRPDAEGVPQEIVDDGNGNRNEGSGSEGAGDPAVHRDLAWSDVYDEWETEAFADVTTEPTMCWCSFAFFDGKKHSRCPRCGTSTVALGGVGPVEDLLCRESDSSGETEPEGGYEAYENALFEEYRDWLAEEHGNSAGSPPEPLVCEHCDAIGASEVEWGAVLCSECYSSQMPD